MSWKGTFLLALFALLFLPVSVPGAEQQYLISETQLQSLETLVQKSEQDRRSWESQAHGLNQKLEASDQKLGASEKLAETLNSQLRQERELTRKWQNSYEQSEINHTKEKGEMAAKIIRLETTNKLKDKLLIVLGVGMFLAVAIPHVLKKLF
jgi:Skp family chaperone for outer membrane proteins